MNTTFTQMINAAPFVITVPQNKVERLLDKVDALVERGNLVKAMELIAPYLGGAAVVPAPPKVPTGNKGAAAAKIIEDNRSQGRAAVIKILCETLNITYANAHYYVRKAGL